MGGDRLERRLRLVVEVECERLGTGVLRGDRQQPRRHFVEVGRGGKRPGARDEGAAVGGRLGHDRDATTSVHERPGGILAALAALLEAW